jgi:hypothetical protein
MIGSDPPDVQVRVFTSRPSRRRDPGRRRSTTALGRDVSPSRPRFLPPAVLSVSGRVIWRRTVAHAAPPVAWGTLNSGAAARPVTGCHIEVVSRRTTRPQRITSRRGVGRFSRARTHFRPRMSPPSDRFEIRLSVSSHGTGCRLATSKAVDCLQAGPGRIPGLLRAARHRCLDPHVLLRWP